MHERLCLSMNFDELSMIFDFSAAVSQRPQPQSGDRHQIDDMQGNHARTTPNASPITAARTGSIASLPAPPTAAAGSAGSLAATASIDNLGPLPPGWQQSRNENDRIFFIDHINKRTTWVMKTKSIRTG